MGLIWADIEIGDAVVMEDGRLLDVVPGRRCKLCYFGTMGPMGCYDVACRACERTDGRNVIYVERKKEGVCDE